MSLDLSGQEIVSLIFGEKDVLVEYSDGREERVNFPPGGLKELRCTHNYLTTLEGFPKGLERLICSFNKLTTLEGLPEGLKGLWCYGNRLTTLEGLPRELKKLQCSDNQLTTLEGLPKGLEKLQCSDNQLITLEGLPKGLKELNCSYNRQLKYIEPSPAELKIIQVPDHLKEKYSSYSDLRNSFTKYKTLERRLLSFLVLTNIGLPTLEILEKCLNIQFKNSF